MMTSHPPVSSTLRTAINQIVDAAAKADRLDRVAKVLHDITARFHSLGELVHEASDDEVLLYASDTLTIYHITLTPGLQYPPHSHLMDALIGIYQGKETNFIYPRSDGRVQVPERCEAIAPEVVHLSPDIVHAVANPGMARSGALHVYLGDLLHTKRQMWRFTGDLPDAFDNDRYLAEARPIEP